MTAEPTAVAVPTGNRGGRRHGDAEQAPRRSDGRDSARADSGDVLGATEPSTCPQDEAPRRGARERLTGAARSRQKSRGRSPRPLPPKPEGRDQREAGPTALGKLGPQGVDAEPTAEAQSPQALNAPRAKPKPPQSNKRAPSNCRLQGNPKTQGRSPPRAWG